ncbi:MAG: hypothetical protein ACD_3C00035G0011 [uncultured bacterium (gcode 4)]|uniref:Uncharacterized protein n=1 Tax=uncultured bacterium (gcode 4) TaxID=1234023 RepID=K2FCA2_9BACT|nr:MAG: hypothetical protein ACD_3C00035G0011 [uncultured bacterium (gcode 4)]
MYKWAIIEESLTDNRILNDIKILELEITSDEEPEDRWHIFTVMMDKDQIMKLAWFIKPAKYYAHFWSWDEMLIAYPNKIFEVSLENKNTWKDAIEHGLSIDIPLEQLDFLI